MKNIKFIQLKFFCFFFFKKRRRKKATNPTAAFAVGFVAVYRMFVETHKIYIVKVFLLLFFSKKRRENKQQINAKLPLGSVSR